jgi:hypothetical protein
MGDRSAGDIVYRIAPARAKAVLRLAAWITPRGNQ